LGGSPPPVISGVGDRPFSVDGDTFVGSKAALGRSCDKQHNACANAANSGALAGGVGQCDAQNTQCKAANSLKRRATPVQARQAASFGSCSNPSIVFKEGLDGRNTPAFIAANQDDFNHGSALNIAVIAGFICQRLGSPCNAPAAVQQACAQASAAAVATTQDQTAADTFNALIGGVAAAVEAPVQTETVAAAPTETAAADGGKQQDDKNNGGKMNDDKMKGGKKGDDKMGGKGGMKNDDKMGGKGGMKDDKGGMGGKKGDDKKQDKKKMDHGKNNQKGNANDKNKGKGKPVPPECLVPPTKTGDLAATQVIGAVVMTITSCV
jgi:hypothetical protein